MSKKIQTQTSATAVVAKEVENIEPVVDALVQAYMDAEAKATSRHAVAGRNVPYGDVKGIVELLQKKVGKDLDVGAAKNVVTDMLTAKYEGMPPGMDRISVKVGTELVTMTKTEFKELRVGQLNFSKKEGNVYRMIYQIVKKNVKKE